MAGSFYPADEDILSQEIENYLADVELEKEIGRVKVLIVPHAGLRFSGKVAAHGFKALQRKGLERVVLIGSSHQYPVRGAVVDNHAYWQTPLGKVSVDQEFARILAESVSGITLDSEPHKQEHSLEIELPFLQTVLGDFKIVPILINNRSSQLIDQMAQYLSKNGGKATVVVISSDLSHYPSHSDANRIDKETIDAITSGSVAHFLDVVEKDIGSVTNLATRACGEVPIVVGMETAKNLGAKDIRLLKYANSGDVTGDKRRVVGYAAIAFPMEKPTSEKDNASLFERGTRDGGSSQGNEKEQSSETTPASLGENQQQLLLNLARETLECFVREGEIPELSVDDPSLQEQLGAFVTLKKPEDEQNLRGCMGVIEAKRPLWKVVQDRTVAAASKDPRFLPVTPDELDNIEIEISVLSKPRLVDDPSEIELGKHGVILEKNGRGGVFLPQVAEETGWDLENFLGHLCTHKAGLRPDCWKSSETCLFIFTAQVFPE
ncbi:MAG: AmmeMemoRadiSam system protein B [Patescibacteria group bacterium]